MIRWIKLPDRSFSCFCSCLAFIQKISDIFRSHDFFSWCIFARCVSFFPTWCSRTQNRLARGGTPATEWSQSKSWGGKAAESRWLNAAVVTQIAENKNQNQVVLMRCIPGQRSLCSTALITFPSHTIIVGKVLAKFYGVIFFVSNYSIPLLFFFF